MYPLKRLLVGIDQSPTDDILIQFCARIANMVSADKIYLIHAARDLELPDAILKKYPDLIAPVDENISRETNHLINKYFDDSLKSRTEILIVEGNPSKTILKEITIKEIDMLVMGKKSQPGSTGYLARKMALLATCSVAIIADNIDFSNKKPLFKNVLVPVDFSDYSLPALELAKQLHEHKGVSNIECQYVFSVPAVYKLGSSSYNEILRMIVDNSKNQMKELLHQANIKELNVNQLFSLDKSQNIPLKIHETINKNGVDLVIMGSKGRTAAASLLLGSNTEKVIDYCDNSIIVIKDKRHNLDVIDVLLNS